MKTVILLLGLVGAAVCYPWGIPQQVPDTPEVAAAKSAHLAAHAKARYSGAGPSWGAQERSWNNPEDDGSWTENKYDGQAGGSWQGSNGGSWQGSNDGSWQGGDNGRSWRGNDEEASWRGDSSADDGSYKDDGSWRNYDDGSYRDDHNSESGSGSWNSGSESGSGSGHWDNHHERKWTGPVALPPGYDKNGAPLQVLDTPEVAAAKAAHLAAHGRHY